MGTVHAEITLKNVMDEGFAREGYITTADIRTATVTAVVDTGSMYLVIPEELCKKLGLAIMEEKTVRTASGQRVISKVTDAVEIMALSLNSPPLFGYPMEYAGTQ